MDFYKKYAFPANAPELPFDDHGWFSDATAQSLVPFVRESRVVLELGTWLGKSTRAWLANSTAKIVCIDTWRGSREHAHRTEQLQSLFEVFLSNQRAWKDRVFPMRMTTVRGILELQRYPEVQPDFIFIDASHQYEDVFVDLTLCSAAYPEALIVGDDWGWPNKFQNARTTVREAVEEFSRNHGIKFETDGWTWKLQRPA